MMERVEFFFAGVQKGGTTSLHSYCAQHPDLSPPAIKEPHHFDDETIDWAAPDHRAYHALYDQRDDGRMRYDGTPIHGFWPQALTRIRAYNPQAKLVFLFRDPLARAWSHWCMEWARGGESLPFAEAIREGRLRMPPEAPADPAWRVYSYVERGRYGAQVAQALELFGREQLLFLKSEDFGRDHPAVLAQLSDFLGVAPFPASSPRRDNARVAANYPEGPNVQDRALVQAELAEDTALFAQLTGLDIAEWSGHLAWSSAGKAA